MICVSMRMARALALALAAAPFGLLSSGASAGDVQELQPLSAQPAAAPTEMINESSNLWFVELRSRPTAAGGNAADTRRDKEAFRASAADSGVKFSERYAFDRLWNGLSVEASAAEAGKLAQLSGVKAIYPVALVSVPDNVDPGSAADMATALAMTGADFAQNVLGLTGEGIRVAIMDTGIDYNHPDLGAGFGPDYRVAYGYDLVGDDFDANPNNATFNPIPTPDPDPMDCNGHGTHVAGITGASAAAAGGVTGVAPDVTFGAYRVFGCNGSTTADIMIAAMELALDDGMQVLNMSIGSAFQWPQYPTAVAANNLVNQGMVVVASIGNSGASGLYSAGAPGLGEYVIGVASFDNTAVSLNAFTISPDDTAIGYGPATAAPLPPTSGTLPMARTGTTTTPDDGCAPIGDDLTGHAALIRRGGCTFHTKALNAQNAGAAAVVLYNSSAGRFSPTVAGTTPITIPVVAISGTEGALIDGRLQVGSVDMTWTDQQVLSANPTGGLISSFSSYGLSPDLALKPDIGAPGGLIRSTFPLAQGSYATISGTSMSSPHVAGVVALLLEARPDTAAHAVRDILQNSADPKVWWGNPPLGFLDQVHRQGAGMVDAPGAILSSATVTPAKLSLGESEAGPYTATLTIHNHGSSAQTFDLGHVPALSTGPNTFSPSAATGFAGVAFSAPSVAVPAGGSATVDVTITANAALADLSQYGGYIVLTDVDPASDVVYRVPYAGLKGDYQAKVVLVPTANAFPLVGLSVGGGSFAILPDDALTFSMQDGDIPSFLVHFDHHARYMEMNIRHAATGAPVHPVFHKTNVFEYLPRNSTATGFFAFDWDGSRLHSNGRKWEKTQDIANGDYVIELRVLKALGEPANPDHWETWTSPTITVARPTEHPGQGPIVPRGRK